MGNPARLVCNEGRLEKVLLWERKELQGICHLQRVYLLDPKYNIPIRKSWIHRLDLVKVRNHLDYREVYLRGSLRVHYL